MDEHEGYTDFEVDVDFVEAVLDDQVEDDSVEAVPDDHIEAWLDDQIEDWLDIYAGVRRSPNTLHRILSMLRRSAPKAFSTLW